MVKIQLGKKLDFGKPIDLGDALYEQSKANVQLIQKITISGKTKSMGQMGAPITTPKVIRKKIELGVPLDFGKKLDFGKELCL